MLLTCLILNFFSSIFLSSYELTIKHFVKRYTTKLSHHIGVFHLKKCINRRLDNTMRIGRTFALRKHILYTHTLQNSTHSTTCDDTRTRSGWLQEDLCSTIFTNLLVRYGPFQHGYTDKILLCIIYTFLHSRLNLLCLPKSVTYNSILVSNHNDGCKSERTTAFGNFGHSIDCDKTIFEFYIA